MILLIHRTKWMDRRSYVPFKFHYDSINSKPEEAITASWSAFKFHYDSINSTSPDSQCRCFDTFKFHYDSINSTGTDRVWWSNTSFKFHYDSINSFFPDLFLQNQRHLNSIMILLIHIQAWIPFPVMGYLNSIMILLIQNSWNMGKQKC